MVKAGLVAASLGSAWHRRKSHFVKVPELRRYSFGGLEILTEVTPDVFPPSCITPFMVGNITISTGEKVVDIGTGSGILAIFAAKMGGIVSATDTSADAIDAAEKNAVLNGVKLALYKGRFFAGLDEKFDVIVANLPQEIVPVSYLESIGPKLSKTIDGGKLGNQHVLKFLELAKKHVHKDTRIFLPVYTVTDYASTLRKILLHYNARLVAFQEMSTKEFVPENKAFFRSLNERGKTRIFKRGKKWVANAYLFELTQKTRI